MIEEQVRKRIRGDFAYQSEKVRNLLRAIYRDPVLAWEEWNTQIKRQRFDVFQRNLRQSPQMLGRMNGTLRFNFWKSPDYREAEHALADLFRLSGQWRSAQVQVEQMEARIAEAVTQEPEIKNRRKTQSQSRIDASKPAPEHER